MRPKMSTHHIFASYSYCEEGPFYFLYFPRFLLASSHFVRVDDIFVYTYECCCSDYWVCIYSCTMLFYGQRMANRVLSEVVFTSSWFVWSGRSNTFRVCRIAYILSLKFSCGICLGLTKWAQIDYVWHICGQTFFSFKRNPI